MNHATYTLQYGSVSIQYALRFAGRRTLAIRVHPDTRVEVIAPHEAPLEKIERILRAKARWILRQQQAFLSFHPLTPPRLYIAGETHLYLGRQYKLKILSASPEYVAGRVRAYGGILEVFSDDKTPAIIQAMLDQWYRARAAEWFAKLIPLCQTKFPAPYRTALDSCTWQIRNMEKRWGSCTAKGKLLLNSELIKAPKGCIEYVILHELCHRIHHDHTRAFYDLLAQVLPDWTKWKDRLERSMV